MLYTSDSASQLCPHFTAPATHTDNISVSQHTQEEGLLPKTMPALYLCFWAIASDVQLSAEFSNFLSKQHAGRWHITF